MKSALRLAISLALINSASASASLYFEAGTGLGRFTKADAFFGTAVSSKSGFSGSVSAYYPITRPQNFAHVDLGIQTRFTSTESTSGSTLTLGSANLGIRFEVWRFYFGGGYSPINFISERGEGLLGLHTYPSNSSYFAEGGAIWKVIPEFQIVAAVSLEYGTSGSPSPLTEYGLRFRFPINPRENGGSDASSFDGFRYPFGIMK